MVMPAQVTELANVINTADESLCMRSLNVVFVSLATCVSRGAKANFIKERLTTALETRRFSTIKSC